MRREFDNRPNFPAIRPTTHTLKAGLLAFLFWPLMSMAHELSIQECVEGGEFIKNAALARDRGVSESYFISKIRDDIEVIQGFPRELRWFVQDEDDAVFLIEAAASVFQQPKLPRMHQAEFIVSFLAKTKSDGDSSSGL